jgi:hypothetical protein
VLVRRDLPAAQIAVQAVHAAIDAARHFLPADHPHPHLVLCRVSSERDLFAAADRLDRLGIRFQLFREPDRAGEATALATEPLCPARRSPLARYPCLTRADLLAAPETEPEPRGSVPRPGSPGHFSEGLS